jgi:anti-sigma B factor antagonist
MTFMPERKDLNVQVEQVGSTAIVRPDGEIDLGSSPVLRRCLSSIQQAGSSQSPRGGAVRLVIDLTQVPYMDSSGVATLVEAMQVARQSGGDIILCGLQERVRSIFEIARLETVFTIAPTAEEALQAEPEAPHG